MLSGINDKEIINKNMCITIKHTNKLLEQT